jgi:hypothetical protein
VPSAGKWSRDQLYIAKTSAFPKLTLHDHPLLSGPAGEHILQDSWGHGALGRPRVGILDSLVCPSRQRPHIRLSRPYRYPFQPSLRVTRHRKLFDRFLLHVLFQQRPELLDDTSVKRQTPRPRRQSRSDVGMFLDPGSKHPEHVGSDGRHGRGRLELFHNVQVVTCNDPGWGV